ncbi:MAG: ion transporter [Verrucomicrobiota bacterium]
MNSKIQSLRERLWRVIFLSDTPTGKRFDVALLLLIVASVLAVMLESVDSISAEYGSALIGMEWFFTVVFTLEYAMRIFIARRPWRYIFSFFGIVDLLSVLPTYAALFFTGPESLAVIRVLRILRMFRVLKMVRHMGEARILLNALRSSRPKITVFVFSVLTLVTIVGTLIYLIEGPENGFTSIPKSVYWAIVTVTTVGYGDIKPMTGLGQAIAAFMMLVGYAILAVPTGIVGLEVWREAQVGERECQSCGTGGHLVSANYCRECGEKLEQLHE